MEGLKRKSKFKSIDEYNKFEEYRININIGRVNYCSLFLIPLSIILLIFDVIALYRESVVKEKLMVLILAHGAILIVSILWQVYFIFFIKNTSLRVRKVIYCIYYNLILYISVFMSLNKNNETYEVSTYIISTLAIYSLIYIPPISSAIMNGIIYILMNFFIIFSNNTMYHINILVNITVTLAVAILISFRIYNCFLENYMHERELIKSKEKIEVADRARTEFFTNVSHELKTPLNIIYTANQMINITAKNDNYRSEKFLWYLNITKQNADRLQRLIGNLIDITKIDDSNFNINKTNIDIVLIVENIVQSAAGYIESQGISVVFDTEFEELIMACDIDSIERIILNLLSNAIKFTEKGGRIFVSIGKINDNIYIRVEDTGIGIPKNMQDEIFNRFFKIDKSTYRKKEGSGIGLALVKSLVELHGGTISVKSEINCGSIFTVTLPIVLLEESKELEENIQVKNNEERVQIEFSDIYNW